MTRVQSEAAKAAGLPVEKVTVNNHLLGGGFGRKLEPDMVVAAVRIAKQVDGPVKVVWTREEDIQHDIYRRSIATRSRPGCRTARSSAGNTASQAPPSSRAGCRPRSRRASTSTRSIARSTCPTTFPTSMSNMSGPSRRRCRPGSGAASAPTTTCLRSNVSWTNSRARRARIRLISVGRCSERIRVCWPRSISRRKNPIGASRFRRASDAASACSRRSAASSRPWWKRKSMKTARCICAA